MILHEIATNAAKYGALSNDTGTVTLDWEIIDESDGRKLRMIWTEAAARMSPRRSSAASDRG